MRRGAEGVSPARVTLQASRAASGLCSTPASRDLCVDAARGAPRCERAVCGGSVPQAHWDRLDASRGET